MQQNMMWQATAARCVATDPKCKRQRYAYVFGGILVLLVIGAFFLPAPLSDQLLWINPTSSYPESLSPFWLSAVFMYLLYLLNLWLFTGAPSSRRWGAFERNRQRAARASFSDTSIETYPLPEMFMPLPPTVVVRMKRSWRVTRIAGYIYAPIVAVILGAGVFSWQIHLNYLLQQREVSGWMLLGTILYILFFCCLLFPIIKAFLFAPRQCLIATQDGLICHRELRFSYIPWYEARLFAVIAKEQDKVVYELASRTTIIRWVSQPGYIGALPVGIMGISPLGLACAENSIGEYEWHIRQIVTMVAQCTHLPLYDLRNDRMGEFLTTGER
jgi:hypothetical protein